MLLLGGCGLLSEEKLIAYTVGEPGSRDIVVARSDGRDRKVIIDNVADDFSPIWSPDHSRIAFLTNRDGNVELYISPADGSTAMRVTNTGVGESQPTWSPDGQRLAYVSPDNEGVPRVFWVRLTDLLPNRLIFESNSEVDPAWSPNGTWIAFAAQSSLRASWPERNWPRAMQPARFAFGIQPMARQSDNWELMSAP